jgi:hypothetical protein
MIGMTPARVARHIEDGFAIESIRPQHQHPFEENADERCPLMSGWDWFAWRQLLARAGNEKPKAFTGQLPSDLFDG